MQLSRLFICSVLPNSLIKQVKSPQASNNFCFDLINNDCFNEVFSIVPPSYFHDELKKTYDNVKYFSYRRSSSRIFGFVVVFFLNIKCAINARKYKNIWFYNILNSNFFCYILLRFFFRKKVYVIFADYTPSTSLFTLNYYIPFLLKKACGMVSLSSRTLLNNKNIQYLAGILPLSKITNRHFEKKERFTFLFSGVLGDHTGLKLAIETFKLLPEFTLIISGIGSIDDAQFLGYKNIKYLGYLLYSDYLKLYDKVDVCLSLRDPNYAENANNFPSKIVEYFSQNKIVISTIDYPELRNFNYFKCEYNAHLLSDLIVVIQNMSEHELVKYANNNRSLADEFSEKKWKDIFNLIERKIV